MLKNPPYGITIVVGGFGTGKTAYAVAESIRTIKQKTENTVWLNMAVDFRKIKQRGVCFWGFELTDVGDMTDGLFVVDEAHAVEGGGSWEWQKLSQYGRLCIGLMRHLRMRMIYITQNYRDMNPFIRRRAQRVRILHRLWRYSWYQDFKPGDINDEGEIKKKRAFVFNFLFAFFLNGFWHTNKIHACYDDEALFGELMKQRPPRNWKENGTGAEVLPEVCGASSE